MCLSCQTVLMFSEVTGTKVSLKIATVFCNEHSEAFHHIPLAAFQKFAEDCLV